MANNNRNAEVSVHLNGTEEAGKKIDEMVRKFEELRKKIEETKLMRSIYADSDPAKWKALGNEIKQMEKDFKMLGKAIRDTQSGIYATERNLEQLGRLSEDSLKSEQRIFKRRVGRASPLNDEEKKRLQEDAEKLIKVTEELERRKNSVLGYTSMFQDIENAADKSLTAARQRLQELIGATKQNAEELKTYREQLAKIQEEEQRRVSSKAGAVMGNLGGSSVDEIRNAIKVTEQLRDAQKLGSQEWVRYNDEIQRAQKYLSDFNELGKQLAMADRMNDLGKASTASLAELKKFWQEQVDGAERGSAELARYESKLQRVIEEEQRRVSSKATGVIGDVKGGTFEGTIGETKEAIKLLEEYKKSLKLTDTDGLKEVDEVIKNLNDRLKLSTEEVMSLQDALKQVSDIGEGGFDGTYEDLEKLKKTLEEYKKQLKITDTQGLKEINEALENISQKTQSASDGVENIDNVLDNIKSVPLEKLEKAAAALQRRLSMTARTTNEYVTASVDLRRVNAEIDRVKKRWKEHDNQIVATMKRLTSYVLVYAGFNEVWGRTKQFFGENVELSDSLADIQKTTGLSAEAVGELSREIDSIDTRTAQKELHDLAYEAGKLGISAKEDVLGFVRAGNQLLVALGEDLGGAEAVRQLMKVNAILGETQKLGIEKSLLATGSAINEITQTSRASAGAITDIVTRIGAIGNAANLSMADLIALAGSADALGQQAEMSGTALNKFISSLTANTTEVAQAVGLSDDYLKDMINQGKTMEAIIAVLDKMNAMGGLDVLNPIIKDLGSDGERIKQVLVTLSGGIDELKAQVFTSSRAFAEATSVTNEYNIKNENAAAIIARMGNSIKENLVNSGLVAWMTDVLRWLDSLPRKWERAEDAIKAFAIALSSLTGFLIAVSGAIQKASFNFLLFCDNVKNGTIGVGSALRNLKRAFTSNPFGWLVLGITAVVDALIFFKNEVKEAMKYQSEFDLSTEKEVAELENLRYAIDRANKGTGEKAALIKQLNDKYGAYLGFMVTENNYAEKQEYIYKMINERLKESIALKMRDKMTDNIVGKYADKLQDTNTNILSALKGIDHVGETNLADAARLVSEGIDKVIEDNINAPENKLVEIALQKFFKKYVKITEDGTQVVQSSLRDYVKEMIEIRKKMDEETRSTRMYLEDNERLSRKKSTQLMQEDLKKQTDSGILGSEDISKLKTYSQQATTFINRLREDIAMLGEQQERNGELSKEEAASLKEKKALLEQYVKSSQEADKRIQALGMRSVWGESMDLDKAGVDKLVATYKKLEGMMKSINEDKDYADTFASRGFKSAKEEYEALKKMEEDVKKVLADKWGRDEHGNWLNPKKGKSGGRGEKDAMKEQMEAALAALETYFVNRQTVIKEQAAKEEITAEEMNRQLEKNEFNHLDARVKLRKMFLGELGAMTEEEKKQYGLQEKDFEKLSKFLMDKGSAMRDGIRLGIAEDLLKMREDLLKHQEAIRKILLEDDYAGMVDQEFADAIDRIELLFGKGEDMAVKAGESRLLRMKELSKEAYLINEEELKSRMSAMEEFSGWERGKVEEDYAALLVMLRKYHDDYESAENREVERRRRIADKKWKKSGEKDAWDETDRNAESDVELMQGLQGLGLASEGMVEDAKLKMYRLRLEASKAYMEQLQKEMDLEVAKAYSDKMIAEDMYRISKESGVDDPELKQQAFEADMAYEEAKRQQALMTLEARQKVNEAMTELEKQETEVQKRKLNTLKGYTDAVVSFGEQMGEAAFGEVEDRKAAAKQLLQTTMKLTKDLIMQRVQELLMKKVLGKQEVANETATQGTITALHGSQAISDIMVTQAKTQGDIAAGTASGSAKTIGELGWWGIPLIAVIGAALSALMGLAMGKLNKAKEEVASATGVSSNKGRVAAGMLTYAKGDYPVLGNDGKIYNASYEKELKTGVYGGGAHFGIFSEKKPEMIVDGDTTKKIMLDYPHIYESILTIARHGQLKSAALPTYASGSYPGNTSPSALPGMVVAQGEPVNAEMMAMLSGVASALNALTDRLNKPINATMDPYAANKQIQKADRFMRKNGLLG